MADPLSTMVHVKATTLRILADKMEENALNQNINELAKVVQIAHRVTSELVVDVTAGQSVQERKTHQH